MGKMQHGIFLAVLALLTMATGSFRGRDGWANDRMALRTAGSNGASSPSLVTKVYPAADFMIPYPNFTGGGFSAAGVPAVGSLGHVGPVLGGKSSSELIALIKKTINPEVWDEVGGNSVIGVFREELVVTASPDTHEKLAAMLKGLRDAEPPQVTISEPQTSVENQFEEHFAVPPIKAFGLRTNPLNPGNEVLGGTDVLRGSLDRRFGAHQGFRGSLVSNTPVLTVPGNGAVGSMFIGQQVPFVTDAIPIVSSGAVAFQPVVTYFPDGVSLQAQAVVSPDRRYVRVTSIPVFSRVQPAQSVRKVRIGAVAGAGLP